MSRAKEPLPMAKANVPLETLMNWVQALVVHPHCVDTALDDDAVKKIIDIAPERINELVLPSKTLTPSERLGIYAGMYPMRMRDALATDFPCVKKALGDDGWGELVDAYIVDHYSVHPNLNQLGRGLPAFIREQKQLKQATFLAELAELEQAMVEVFDAPESAQADVNALLDLRPDQWSSAVFHSVAAFRLCAFQYPVNGYLQCVKTDQEPPSVKRGQTYVAVYRKSYVTWRMNLTRPQYRILKLLTEGKTVFDALLKGSKGGGSDVAGLAQQLTAWFKDWFEEGWFSSIELKTDVEG